MQSTQVCEFQTIIQKNPVLASTGCTPQFCQAGRLIHSDEPRVGENRPLEVVKQEALGFLWQLWQEGVYTEEQYTARHVEVLKSLEESEVIEPMVVDGVKTVGKTATWTQTPKELLHGIRLAWKNSRKCIMRSHYMELDLCDLRHITTSAGMVKAVIQEAIKAFNKGQIRPTVFAFPPRSTSGTGPMFLSKQLLNFAGYRRDDGSILGDPSNVELTEDIIELGWAPPEPRSHWDLLPIVAMADNDAPAWADVPAELRDLVDIRHPRFENFQKLGLKWYQFPALSRLGFDIGGVQYTATPFIGWYMDAEIGVRNLADSFRYNALPDVAKALGFDIENYKKNPEYAEIEAMEDLPDYEQLIWMSRAQAELNYAVRCSFLQKGVSCIGTLAASSDWTRFDDEHASKHGYRLNSDPYWIAPPQGSIVPVWHRGGAPNYQPKPLIARHRFDPVKSWRRRRDAVKAPVTRLVKVGEDWVTEHVTPVQNKLCIANGTNAQRNGVVAISKRMVHIYYSSTGTSALKLAEKLRRRVKELPGGFHVDFNILNMLDLRKIKSSDPLLMVVSTTGDGRFPANGAEFEAAMKDMAKEYNGALAVKYSILGVGDSAYPTFNAASAKLHEFMKAVGGIPIANGLTKGNTAVEALPMKAFNRWWSFVKDLLTGEGENAAPNESTEDECFEHYRMLETFKTGRLLSKAPAETGEGRIAMITMDLGDMDYIEMSHLRLLPYNTPDQVGRALTALGVSNDDQRVPFMDPTMPDLSYKEFLQHYVDLEGKFKDLAWLSEAFPAGDRWDTDGTVLEDLERFPALKQVSNELRMKICLEMPLLRPRSFSVASSAKYLGKGLVEIMVRLHKGGRFSDKFLSAISPGDSIGYSPVSIIPGQDLISSEKHLIAICTGTGFAPIRSLLQRKIHILKDAESQGMEFLFQSPPISIFVGFKAHDEALFEETLSTAERYGLVDMIFRVPSNKQKRRVQHYVEDNKESVLAKIKEGSIYVCGAKAMVNDMAAKLSDMIGADVRQNLGRRYVEEIF
ncbi:nitric oxide synthase [Aspergillus pseudonomiae]|uniref:nitric-oxide synthase (NADPH) n=1 Tax=Aspergillus pseudonomiae TaxID=1506151 RepID=A0A5N7D956_9EURO|nr:nitric oxide synthase [Aspergillus pseudonomiae]KAB8262117.1 nitric oxide synthase [Aspergillus pseudonomiae]KAE8402695.1 nitric oxide synthase [Aspergillus pseudonomiae]